jgi:hypothetical protein
VLSSAVKNNGEEDEKGHNQSNGNPGCCFVDMPVTRLHKPFSMRKIKKNS